MRERLRQQSWLIVLHVAPTCIVIELSILAWDVILSRVVLRLSDSWLDNLIDEAIDEVFKIKSRLYMFRHSLVERIYNVLANEHAF